MKLSVPLPALLLDLETLEDLALLDAARPGLIADLVAKFEVTRSAQLQLLHAHLLNREVPDAALLLHSLRGGAAALGMLALSEAFDLIESRLPAGEELVSELAPLMRRSIAALRLKFAIPATSRS